VDAVLHLGLPAHAATATIALVSTPEVTDGTLIERVAAREREAFEELYGRYARPVLGLALRRIGDRGRAEDSVQEVFAAVWRSAGSYDRARGPGGAWLYTIARNAIVDAQRRRPAPTVADPPEAVSTSPTPDQEAEASWSAWQVHRALETLPVHERAVIDLAYFSGLSQSEIADFLQIPLGTVKTRTRSGLARLADALEGEL
jgi:RNA polymerase sigma-70 factor (ECF subfamily)